MIAMILAAGFGTRLGELGKQRAKCLVQVGGKAMLEHVVENLKRAGVTEVVINLHHLADQIKEFVTAKNNFDLKVTFSYEKEILGTGGGVQHAAKYLKAAPCFILHNGDIFSELSITELYQAHLKNKSLATLAVMKRETSRPLYFDSSGVLCGWRGEDGEGRYLKPLETLEAWAFSGIQIVSSQIFDLISQQKAPFSTIATYMLAAQNGAIVSRFDMSGAYWIDIGTPQKIEQLEQYLTRSMP